jgi:hypothetical protein
VRAGATYGAGHMSARSSDVSSRKLGACLTYSKHQPPSMAKNCDVWNVPLPSISVATKCAASSG